MTNNIVSLPSQPEPRSIELEISTPGVHCLFRLTPQAARETLALIATWPVTAPFVFQEGELSVTWLLSPEGAAVFRDEITLQLATPIR